MVVGGGVYIWSSALRGGIRFGEEDKPFLWGQRKRRESAINKGTKEQSLEVERSGEWEPQILIQWVSLGLFWESGEKGGSEDWDS